MRLCETASKQALNILSGLLTDISTGRAFDRRSYHLQFPFRDVSFSPDSHRNITPDSDRNNTVGFKNPSSNPGRTFTGEPHRSCVIGITMAEDKSNCTPSSFLTLRFAGFNGDSDEIAHSWSFPRNWTRSNSLFFINPKTTLSRHHILRKACQLSQCPVHKRHIFDNHY